ncbi:DUF305 domain-containing protein [Saccharothrix sp. ST-888]|uniref:DUF305 domain-containing protein n=1 Tax=Saccharothrix sp. ST-888 TaxID=1427391 RepID=UPI0005ECCBC0|nr:DUF305 domain-containing protein [Saccharothrix sp. ST-888]KJK55779.1 hypothetical protein UK12_26645 [Saccharothrix sp. ST-888]
MNRTSRIGRTHIRRAALIGAAGLAALALAACSSSKPGSDQAGSSAAPSASVAASASTSTAPTGGPGSAAAGEHNSADVSFAQGMVPHHRQAVAMAELAAERASSAQVKELAAKIKGAQDPEIALMSGWLTGWGQQVPGADMSSVMPGMDHSTGGATGSAGTTGTTGSGHSMPGMMGDDEMAKLKSASGADFDKAFLTMMAAHHEGAVTMAKNELAKGAFQPAKALADSISTSQTAEIAEMKKLLAAG